MLRARRRGALVGVVCSGALALGACSGPAATTVAASGSASTPVGPSTSSAQPATAMRALVRSLGSDLAARRTPGPAVVAPSAAAWRATLATRARAFDAIGVDRFVLDADPGSVEVSGDRATVTAVGGFHVRGAAPGDTPVTVFLTAQRTPDGWRLVDDRGERTLPAPWDLPSVRRVDGPGVVVLGNAPDADLRWYAEHGSAAWLAVGSAWPRRPGGRPVIVAPATVEQLAEQVRSTPDAVGQVAALTVGSLAAGRPALGDVVVVNPAGKRRLTEEGRRTILRHELVHVAIRGTTTGSVPQWLSEGYAVQASWRGGVPEQLRARARRWSPEQRRPGFLPSDASVEGAERTYAYDASAVLVDDLVARHGRPAVVALYERVASGSTVDRAMPAALGESPAQVLTHWHRAIARL